MIKQFCIFILAMPLLFLSCDIVEGGGGDGPSSSSGKTESQKNGIVTFYTTYNEDSVAYYTPELENGWYKCAVSENKLGEFPPQSAAKITYNDKTIYVLVTDLCPNDGNSHWTNNLNYFFDLAENAFAALENKDKGHIDVSIQRIAYETNKNIKFAVKEGSNQWWLAGRFYNMRYPLAKVEYSSNGNTFKEMEKLDGNKNNWWEIKSGNDLFSNLQFRLTDVYGNTITCNAIKSLSVGRNYDLGKNFSY
ncbi:MAG: hypothetical protein HDR33_08665 [Treponema sp.]|nr:hypothetical protein [Treponema sp.]